MEHSDNLNLLGKLAKIYKEIDKIPKKGYNAFHKYYYVQEADAMEFCRNLFNKHKIICLCACDDVIVQGEMTIAKLLAKDKERRIKWKTKPNGRCH